MWNWLKSFWSSVIEFKLSIKNNIVDEHFDMEKIYSHVE